MRQCRWCLSRPMPKHILLRSRNDKRRVPDSIGLLEQFRSMDPKKQKQYRGYIQALEALELRFRNADCTVEMDTAEHLELRKPELT